MKTSNSKKTKIIIIIVAVIIVLVALAIVLALCLKSNAHSNKDKRVLNYEPGNYSYIFYSIVQKTNYFEILEKYTVECFKAPCNPTIHDMKEIKDKQEIENLTTLFDEVFNNTKEKEKRVEENQLTNEQKEIINTVFKNNEIIIIKINYEILNNTSSYDDKYSERGYYIEKMNDTDSVILTIAMGMKNSGGYSITIKYFSITFDTGHVIVHFEETSPGSEQIVSDTIAYPCIKIKFDKEPCSYHIINTEKNEIFKEIEI